MIFPNSVGLVRSSFVVAIMLFAGWQNGMSQDPAPVKANSPSTSSIADADKTKKSAAVTKLEEKIKKQQEDLELLKLFASSLAEIERSYVQPVDRRRLIEAAIDGMLHDLDRYSDYIPPNELENFQTDIESAYGGIGIRVVIEADEDYITVVTPILGSPSYESGVVAGTWIVKIDGQDAKDLTVEDAIEKIKGEIGSVVKIVFRDKKTGEEIERDVKRAIVQVKTVLGDQRKSNDQWDYFLTTTPELEKAKIGYVRINNFGRQTIAELRQTIDDLLMNGMRGLIMDLRFNPGGLLSAAVGVADLFVEKGLIVRTEGRNARPRRWNAKSEGTFGKFPMAILVNSRSASASEIVAACLKDSGRATVIGQRSFGKGSVQNLVELEDGQSLMKLTTAAYFRPNGQNINRQPNHTDSDTWGVKPNAGYEIVLDPKQTEAYMEYRRRRDIIRKQGSIKSSAENDFQDIQLNRAVEFILEELPAKKKTPQKNN